MFANLGILFGFWEFFVWLGFFSVLVVVLGGLVGFLVGFGWFCLFVVVFLGFFLNHLEIQEKKILPAMDNNKFQAWDENLDQL